LKLLALTFFGSAWDQGKHLLEELQAAMFQFLKDPMGFPMLI